MKRLLKKIRKNKYIYEFSDKDIIKGKHYIDLFEDGEFIAEEIEIEFTDDGLLWERIEIYGTYIDPEGKKWKTSMTVHLDLKHVDITLDDVKKGIWSAGDIISLGWDSYYIW